MTSKDSTQDQELLERYKRASDTASAVPSEAVRAAILAEARRVAEQRATEVPGPTFDVSRPAANDSRWKITAFGTAGAALVAALLFAPRLWENAPPPAFASNTTAAVSADKAAPSTDKEAPSEAGAAPPPKLESLRAARNSSESLQEIVVTQATRESSKAAGAASGAAAGKLSASTAPAVQAQPADELAAPKATELKKRSDLPATLARQRSDALAQSAAPEEKVYQQNYAPTAFPASALGAARDARARNAPQPAALQSAAASGDTTQTTALLDQGAALDARDDLGRTPLMLAVMQRKPEVVRLLLDRGADPNIADSAGLTPLQQAKQKHFREIAALLERAGAR